MPRPDATRILIVEDDAGTAALQRRVLERAGYRALAAASAAEALEAIRGGTVHLVLLDNRLPGNVIGTDFLTTLRMVAPDIPVIMVTGSELEGTAIRALRGGARDFIRKDIDYLEQLPQAVARVLQDASLEKQLQTGSSPILLSALLLHSADGIERERETLEELGFQVFGARSAEEALLEIAQREVNLLLIHADTPSGAISAYRRIKDAGHQASAILIGAGGDETLLIESLRAGFVDFIAAGADYPANLRLALQRAAERLRIEARLRESRERLAGIVNSAMDAILLVDERGRVMLFNPAAERLFDVSAAEALEKPASAFIPALTEPTIVPGADGNASSHVETRGVKRGSGDVELEVALAPMLDSSSSRSFLTVVARDITQRKELERHLLQKDKLESLGLLAGGIAHDFNNLLVGILGNSSLALETLSTNNPARPMLKDVITAAETAANLTRQLLAYAGKGRFVTEPVDLSDLVRQISSLLQTTVPKNVQLRMELMEKLPCVDADIAQMQQVILNVVLNAAEAIGDQQGSVLITTGAQHVDEDYVATVLVPAQVEPGDYVCVQVHDTGCGMSQETIDHIFDPFFTTKFTGRGLGLAAALGIVRGHKGAIKVYSTLGQGTTFKLLFPATTQVAAGSKHVELRQASGGETVLVVDDEHIVRRSAKAMLERYAYSVVLAENGKEAVDLFRVLADKVDVVLLDMTMPVMGGEEAFRHLKTIRPDVRVILSSGYNEVEAVRRFAGKGLAGFLQKPYSVVTLVNKIRAVLSEAHGTAQS